MPHPHHSGLLAAQAYLREFYQNLDSLAAVAEILQGYQGFEKVNKATVRAWMAYKPKPSSNGKTAKRIIAAANNLKLHKEARVKVRFAIIRQATELIPIHLLAKYPQWEAECGVKAGIKEVREGGIPEALEALASGLVDIAIAPRGTELKDDQKLCLRRFFEIATIKVGGLFPLDAYHDGQQFAEEVARLAGQGLRAGFLPNADYAGSLKRFLWRHDITRMPPPAPVLNHEQAFELLRDGGIHAVVGHSIFIANCLQNINECLQTGTIAQKERLRKLKSIPDGVFENVSMDVLINSRKIGATVARRALALLDKSVEFITYNPSDPVLIANVNEVTGLNPAGDEKSGKDVLKEYSYKIDGFEKEVLLGLWKC